MSVQYNHALGIVCIIAGVIVVMFALGDLLIRVLIAIAALSLINYGLRLRGLPPLQLLLPLLVSRNRWF